MAKGQDYFQKQGIKHIDYKDTETLRKFINQSGRILPRKVTGNHAKSQRAVTQAIKRARYMGLLPYVIS